ncbi:STAS domain-containing protein [Chitinimonas sp. PSY-7]|uniref:STAS domain-containing protein n=1 Tax=Chitinimonas sp. PSY-7 TaxID=3459088 RepID=UPI0040400CBB
MVFSFFKKKDAEPDASQPKQPRIVQPNKPGQPPAEADSQREIPVLDSVMDFSTIGSVGPDGAGIALLDSSDVLSPAMEQAAIAFANDQVEDAISVLTGELASVEGRHALDTWLMLFDLYQMRNMRPEFDELALKFVVEFERSAPVWQQKSGNKPAAASQGKSGSPYFMFPQKLLSEGIEEQLDQLEKLTTGGGQVRVDFSRIDQIEPGAAAAIVARWTKMKKKKAKLQSSGGPSLADKLKTKIEVMRRVEDEMPYWLLLLEIYQQLGLHDDFENMAVDFAVTFEVSPPSWDATAKTKTAAEVVQEEARLRAEAPPPEPVLDAYSFTGPIVTATEASFTDLQAYADEHSGGIRIDFSRVGRVDFVSAGMLMNTLVGITVQGKPIIIMGANELVVALFRIMGIADITTIVRKK